MKTDREWTEEYLLRAIEDELKAQLQHMASSQKGGRYSYPRGALQRGGGLKREFFDKMSIQGIFDLRVISGAILEAVLDSCTEPPKVPTRKELDDECARSWGYEPIAP